ncbi:hypothetical protein LIER_24957 [Lithospermum erythrorhizon]|uniref:Uncharacterized protein n=1 Tax=Lithospermum erythrorhizon TaxID=34254 RepID=A0AAV3R2V4_LITER
MENVLYSTWAELFRIHCRSSKVIHHILPDVKSEPCDSIPSSHSRTGFFEHKLGRFSICFGILSTIKESSGSIKKCWRSVPENLLVLQMVSGLTEAYNGIGTLIRQSTRLPTFYNACSKVVLEEAGLAKKAQQSTGSLMIARSGPDSPLHRQPKSAYPQPEVSQPRNWTNNGPRSAHPRYRPERLLTLKDQPGPLILNPVPYGHGLLPHALTHLPIGPGLLAHHPHTHNAATKQAC